MNAGENPQEKPKVAALPPPARNRSSDLFNAFDLRRTIREISCARLPPQLLSNLLWSACGIDLHAGPFGTTGRTAASASNSQEIQLYNVALQVVSAISEIGRQRHHLFFRQMVCLMVHGLAGARGQHESLKLLE